MKVNFLDFEYDYNLDNCTKKLFEFIDDGINRFSIFDDFENHYIIQNEKTNRFLMWDDDKYETFSDEDLEKLENGEIDYLIGKDNKEFLYLIEGDFYLIPIEYFDEVMANKDSLIGNEDGLCEVVVLGYYSSLDYFRVNLGLSY